MNWDHLDGILFTDKALAEGENNADSLHGNTGFSVPSLEKLYTSSEIR